MTVSSACSMLGVHNKSCLENCTSYLTFNGWQVSVSCVVDPDSILHASSLIYSLVKQSVIISINNELIIIHFLSCGSKQSAFI